MDLNNLNRINVLNKNLVTYSTANEKIEVFDQKNNLIGYRPLPIPISADLSEEEIFERALQSGYDIGELIEEIVEESVYDENIYDLVFFTSYEESEEGILKVMFLSPTVNDWVMEPAEGIFGWIYNYFVEEDNIEVNLFEQENEEYLVKSEEQKTEGEEKEENYLEEEFIEEVGDNQEQLEPKSQESYNEEYDPLVHTENQETGDSYSEDEVENYSKDQLEDAENEERILGSEDQDTNIITEKEINKNQNEVVEENQETNSEEQNETDITPHSQKQGITEGVLKEEVVPKKDIDESHPILGNPNMEAFLTRMFELTMKNPHLSKEEILELLQKEVQGSTKTKEAVLNEWKASFETIKNDTDTVEFEKKFHLKQIKKVAFFILAQYEDIEDFTNLNEEDILSMLEDNNFHLVDDLETVKASLYKAHLMFQQNV